MMFFCIQIALVLVQLSSSFQSYVNYEGNNSVINDEFELKVGYLTGSKRKEGNFEYSRPGLTISGALTLALHHINKNQFFEPFSNIKFSLELAETYGDEEVSLREVAKLWRENNVSVIIGPQETCLHEARLAASLNIPMISYFCSDEEVSDKSRFSTFARTRPPDVAISKAVASLLFKFGWTSSLVVIYSDSVSDERFKRVANSLSLIFKERGITSQREISFKGPYHHGYGENPFDSIVSGTKDTTRIYVIISEYFEHLGLVLALSKQNLLNGDYLVIGVSMDDYKEEEWNPLRYFKGLLKDESEKEAPEAFRSYLGIVASPPKNFTGFTREVNQFMEMSPFNFLNPLTKYGGYKKIRIEAAYLYDAVFLYARTIRDILVEENLQVMSDLPSAFLMRKDELLRRFSDGKEIAKRLRNISYRSATGHDLKMDENGDAEGNFTLIFLKRKNEEFGLFPVGFFKLSGDLPELALTETIDWIGGSPPLSEPLCGFFGEKCQSDNRAVIGASLIGVVLVLFGVAIFLYMRHRRISRDMDALMWRIDKKDIFWENGEVLPTVKSGSGSQASLTRFSARFAPLVTYRERIFAAKMVDVCLLDSTMKQQLKLLREIRHENLNGIIGACIYEKGILLINEYCSRGSLKDVLENGDIKLDDMFVSSLVGDLLRGLSYLHDSSQFRYHGNLKSTNCLVDSRWNLKLSDFGVVVSGREKTYEIGNHSNPHPDGKKRSESSSSWITFNAGPNDVEVGISPYFGPEFPLSLKDKAKSTIIECYRKGDIYSLGVILWELLRRETLSNYLKIKGDGKIREEICNASIPFWPKCLSFLSGTNGRIILNPLLISPQVIECLRDCLEMDPDLRPDIKSVRFRLRPLHKGMRSNIFDIMIGLMEKYANNLEILVDERTKQLSDEKRKTESLLYELIPASVAEKLKSGQRVAAQNYDRVSIYFSDIIGFTSMSAKSTALQVVEFLNDLYTCFDSVIENFDVYKVETIGDAYMVASGLPEVRESNFHALEMARMALELLEAVRNFRIRHRPNENVKLRIGIHSGPVCAGVVGQKRQRYCLFGDTVNTASRMESTGAALRIHCSETFAQLVEKDFLLEKRGVVDVKGKGDMTTYWLIQKL